MAKHPNQVFRESAEAAAQVAAPAVVQETVAAAPVNPAAAIPPPIPVPAQTAPTQTTSAPVQTTPVAQPTVDPDVEALRRQLAEREAQIAENSRALETERARLGLYERELSTANQRFGELEQRITQTALERDAAAKDLEYLKRMQTLQPQLDGLQYFDKEQAEELNSKILSPLLQRLQEQHQQELAELRATYDTKTADVTKQLGSITEAQRADVQRRTENEVVSAFPDFWEFSATPEFKAFLADRIFPSSASTFGEELQRAYAGGNTQAIKGILTLFKDKTTSAPSLKQVAGVAPTGVAASQPAVPETKMYSLAEHKRNWHLRQTGQMKPEVFAKLRAEFEKAQAEGRVTE